MKILIVSVRGPTNLDRRGGAQDYVRFASAPWVERGHDVSILCAQQRIEGELMPAMENVDGVTVERIGDGSSRFLPLFNAVRQRSVEYDVIVENIMGFPLFLPLAVGKTPLLALKHHFEGAAFIHSQGWVKGLFGMLLENVLQPLIYRRTPFVVVSELTYRVLFSRWLRPKSEVRIIPPGVRHVAPSSRSRSRVPAVLYYGALDTSRKRVDHLIEAFTEVRDRLPDARLLIAGTGPDAEALRVKAGDVEAEFHGYISESDKSDLLAETWLFVSPSMTEGFGITWIEANSAGVPVIVYDLGLDTVDDSCSVRVPVGDVAALARAMTDLLQDDARRSTMSEAARRNAARYDLMSTSENLLSMLGSLVAGSTYNPDTRES